MRKKSFAFLVIMFGCLMLTGCKKSLEKEIVGKWESKVSKYSYVYTFNKDKTCSYDAAGTLMKCKYKIDGDKISIYYDDVDVPFETTISIKNNKLNVIDSLGNDTFYNRIK